MFRGPLFKKLSTILRLNNLELNKSSIDLENLFNCVKTVKN